jgi:pimeloyl-ACP methyl ester carboxylesterase
MENLNIKALILATLLMLITLMLMRVGVVQRGGPELEGSQPARSARLAREIIEEGTIPDEIRAKYTTAVQPATQAAEGRVIANDKLILPPYSRARVSLQTYCLDRLWPAPSSGEKLHLVDISQLLIEDFIPIYEDLMSYSALHPEANLQIQRIVWFMRFLSEGLYVPSYDLVYEDKQLLERVHPGSTAIIERQKTIIRMKQEALKLLKDLIQQLPEEVKEVLRQLSDLGYDVNNPPRDLVTANSIVSRTLQIINTMRPAGAIREDNSEYTLLSNDVAVKTEHPGGASRTTLIVVNPTPVTKTLDFKRYALESGRKAQRLGIGGIRSVEWEQPIKPPVTVSSRESIKALIVQRCVEDSIASSSKFALSTMVTPGVCHTFKPRLYYVRGANDLQEIRSQSDVPNIGNKRILLLIHGWHPGIDGKDEVRCQYDPRFGCIVSPDAPKEHIIETWGNFIKFFYSDAAKTLRNHFALFAVRYNSNNHPYKGGRDKFDTTYGEKPSAGQLAELLDYLGNRELVIVAHSMGGLVARSYMAEYGGVNRTLGLITLGTPHRGSVLADPQSKLRDVCKVAFFLTNTPGAKDLAWNKEELRNLNKEAASTRADSKTTDSKTIAYSGVIRNLMPMGHDPIARMAFTCNLDLGFPLNDGFVPLESSENRGAALRGRRQFEDYDHYQLKDGNKKHLCPDGVTAKSKAPCLFISLRDDLCDLIGMPTPCVNRPSIALDQYPNLPAQAPIVPPGTYSDRGGDPNDPQDCLAIQVSQGQKISLELTGPRGTDFDLWLYKPGSTFASWASVKGNTSNERIVIDSAPETGRYVICIKFASGSGVWKLEIR